MRWHDRRKVSKQSVRYREGTITKHCGNCVMFHSGRCDLVVGQIRADMRCDKWEAK